jgi:BirA family biotin operon repressor/biotin-[acetyl-CoA-carboxylase] ligase
MTLFQVHHLDSIGSTNDEAWRLANAGAPHGTVVHADEQTSGRGRFTRRWFSPPGNLYLSIILRLDQAQARSTELGFVTALAVADAVDALLPRRVRAKLKWPNDVLVNGGKIAGILVEQANGVTVVGVGVNVLHAPHDAPYHVATLAGNGGLATVDGVRDRLLHALDAWLGIWQTQGFAPVRTAWLARTQPPGVALSVTLGTKKVEGTFAGLDIDGALLLETRDGRQRIVSGEIGMGAATGGT